jgi:hypothetical protein
MTHCSVSWAHATEPHGGAWDQGAQDRDPRGQKGACAVTGWLDWSVRLLGSDDEAQERDPRGHRGARTITGWLDRSVRPLGSGDE